MTDRTISPLRRRMTEDMTIRGFTMGTRARIPRGGREFHVLSWPRSRWRNRGGPAALEYYHVVFTLPAPIADIAYQNKAAVYGIAFKAAAETLIAIAADPKHLGARIGLTAVLHTWGSALTHHPHAHWIVPGGGISSDGKEWISCRPGCEVIA